MAFCTELLVLISPREDGPGIPRRASRGVLAINDWLEAQAESGPLVRIDSTPLSAPSGKPWCSSIYGGCFNHLDVVAFLRVVFQQEWLEPDKVQVLLKDEGDSAFTLIDRKNVGDLHEWPSRTAL